MKIRSYGPLYRTKFLIFLKKKKLFERQMADRGSFQQLAHSRMARIAMAALRTGNSTQLSHLDTKNHVTYALTACSQRLQEQEAESSVGAGCGTKYSSGRCRSLITGLNACLRCAMPHSREGDDMARQLHIFSVCRSLLRGF